MCCNKIVKRRLQTNKVSLLPLIRYLQVDNVGNDWLAQDMLWTFPPCNFSLDYPDDILNENYICYIGMYLHGFEKRVMLDINKWSSLGVGETWEQAEAGAIG